MGPPGFRVRLWPGVVLFPSVSLRASSLTLAQLSLLEEKNRMNSMGAYRRSPLQGGGRDASSCCCCCDAWVWLWRQIELELFDQQLLVGVEFRVAAHDQGSAISRREMHIEDLHG